MHAYIFAASVPHSFDLCDACRGYADREVLSCAEDSGTSDGTETLRFTCPKHKLCWKLDVCITDSKEFCELFRVSTENVI